MGGLFHVTKQQVELDGEFKKAGVTAVIAMGGAPGVTNILAKYGAERLDTVEEAHALCGNVDDTDWSHYDGWVVPYSLETLCDEFSVTAPEFIDGHWHIDITGGDGAEELDFGEPAGILEAHFTIHSEPFTFWHTWKDQGLRTATFKLSLPAEFTEQMRFLARIGMTRTDEVEVGGAHVRPRDVLLKVVSQIPKPTDVVLDDVDYLLGVVRGTQGRAPAGVARARHGPGAQGVRRRRRRRRHRHPAGDRRQDDGPRRDRRPRRLRARADRALRAVLRGVRALGRRRSTRRCARSWRAPEAER